MSHILTIRLPDDVYGRIAATARTQLKAPEEAAADLLAHVDTAAATHSTKQAASAKHGDVRQFFGALDGSAGSAKNEDIDADLVREYAGLRRSRRISISSKRDWRGC